MGNTLVIERYEDQIKELRDYIDSRIKESQEAIMDQIVEVSDVSNMVRAEIDDLRQELTDVIQDGDDTVRDELL